MADVLHVQVRETRGKRNARRQRLAGQVPAILYGHGQESISLSVPTDQVEAALRHGSRVVDLEGGVSDKAIIRELQWDTWGTHVLHLDLARVSAHEVVEVEVPIELRGEAPGVKEGGVLDHVLHSVAIQCRATALPEKLELNINELALEQSLTVADLDVPQGVKVLAEPDALVAQCNPALEEEEEAVPGAAAEPEVIGRPQESEEEEGSS